VELIHDLVPIEVSDLEAQNFKMQHGDKCDIWAGEGSQWFAKLKKSASVFVPKAFKFSRTVASGIDGVKLIKTLLQTNRFFFSFPSYNSNNLILK
jgi:hypothetical protein